MVVLTVDSGCFSSSDEDIFLSMLIGLTVLFWSPSVSLDQFDTNNVKNKVYLNEPDSGVPRHQKVGQQTDDCKVDLRKEQKKGKDPHHMHINAVDLRNAEAGRVAVFNAPGLVVLDT